MLEENDGSKNFFVLNASYLEELTSASYLEELTTLTTFDGYKGIQSTNLMVVCDSHLEGVNRRNLKHLIP
jgi:hypothetical protein